ncbi:hypothetical protein FACS189460_5740 [Deltaproteobacteria bacterium]|nr:hypothetical protein FACS189460_5740 [Deltaproteobacteria bacterium]
MDGKVFYKVLASCRIGGAYRRAGEVFSLPRFEVCPKFLIEVDQPKVEAVQGNTPAPGPMPADLGVVRDEPPKDIPMMDDSPTPPRPKKNPTAKQSGVQGDALEGRV